MDSQNILGIIGPSGCGKSTIVAALVGSVDFLQSVPSYTDRPPRPNDPEPDHVFVDADKFDAMEAQGAFMEVVQPFGLAFRYGLPPFGQDKNTVYVLMLREAFVPLLKKHFPRAKLYQIEADYEFAAKALDKRADADLGTRLRQFENERTRGAATADRVFVNTEQTTAQAVAADVLEAIRADFTNI